MIVVQIHTSNSLSFLLLRLVVSIKETTVMILHLYGRTTLLSIRPFVLSLFFHFNLQLSVSPHSFLLFEFPVLSVCNVCKLILYISLLFLLLWTPNVVRLPSLERDDKGRSGSAWDGVSDHGRHSRWEAH